MAMSENSIKVVEFLKENHGKNMTSADVAEALELSKSTVNGVFTALQKKGYGVRVDATVPGTAEISALSVTAEGEAADKAEMSDTIKAIFEYLTANKGVIVTLDDMAAALNADKRVVNGSFNSLVRKGFAARTPVTVKAEVAVKHLVLTEEGLALDPSAEG
jgi:predicted transcriptional regulator